MANSDVVPFVVRLEVESALELKIVGGKGANLSTLSQRGFCVPDAFIITTSAFQYVFNDQLSKDIMLTMNKIDVDNINVLESISDSIKTTITSVALPNDMIDLIMEHYDILCKKNDNMNLHVAVRSSATAEDLPDNSFAGQQDTYLHVTRQNLIEKVKECWASLFTARAISYREKLNIDHKIVQLAVIVQEMVFSEASGVAFTANPITGSRNEVVIDSTLGLGEALVSGLVTPDHYEILMDENQDPEIRIKTIGEKSIRINGKLSGGTETLINNENDKKLEALSDKYIIQLAKLAKQIEKSYNYQPQDLEWSFTKEKIFILQARPITTLFPSPKHAHGQSGLRCMVSFGILQGFCEPMTPLGESTIRTIVSNGMRAVGVNQISTVKDDMSANPLQHYILKSAANRIWIDITGILTSPLGVYFDMSKVDTGMGKIVNYFKRSKLFQPKSIFSSLRTYLFLILNVIPLILRSVRNFLFPRYGKKLYESQIAKFHQFVDEGFEEQGNNHFSHCVNHFKHVLLTLPQTIFAYGAPCIVPAIFSLNTLQKMAKDPIDVLALTRAVESNPTTEMNLVLWKLTLSIRENDETSKLFEKEITNNLTNIYRNQLFDKNIQSEMNTFFEKYGCRGIGEIDIGRKRWCEDPQLIFEQIKNYLKMINPDRAIDKRHEQSKQSAYDALNRMENQLRWPFIQRPILHFLFNRLKILFSLRESPKFHGMIQTFGKCREALFNKALIAVQENLILQVDDICFLYIDELQSLAFDTDNKQYQKANYWKTVISERRMQYNREMTRKRIPLVLLSNGTTYYDASTIPDDNNDQVELVEGEFIGSPVSPGIYEGKVRIVNDPMNSQLQPGEILVCTATDPAWTPLFPIAGALVLEMGGMLQHGAIVSREYGLPAVVGVLHATTIFHNGQHIQVNGSTGRIKTLLD